MPDGLARYCLDHNPFNPAPPDLKFRPIRDRVNLVSVGGFRGNDELDDYLKQRKDLGQLAQVLVVGQNRTGRTSVARYVLNRYAEMLEIKDPGDFVLLSPVSINNLVMEVHQRLLGDLYGQVSEFNGFDETKLPDRILTELGRSADQLVLATLGALFADLAKWLRKQPPERGHKGLGIYFDFKGNAPPGLQMIETATRLFAWAPAVMVATEALSSKNAGGETLGYFEGLEKEQKGHVIRLDLLSASDAAQLAKELWKGASPLKSCPRKKTCDLEPKLIPPAPDCVRRTNSPFQGLDWDSDLGKTPLPIRHMLWILWKTVKRKAEQGDGNCWPEDKSLQIDDKNLSDSYKDYLDIEVIL